jgi:hypothetical protein
VQHSTMARTTMATPVLPKHNDNTPVPPYYCIATKPVLPNSNGVHDDDNDVCSPKHEGVMTTISRKENDASDEDQDSEDEDASAVRGVNDGGDGDDICATQGEPDNDGVQRRPMGPFPYALQWALTVFIQIQVLTIIAATAIATTTAAAAASATSHYGDDSNVNGGHGRDGRQRSCGRQTWTASTTATTRNGNDEHCDIVRAGEGLCGHEEAHSGVYYRRVR